MSRVIMAKIILRDACDPDLPGDCAPIIQVEEASELEGLVSDHGVIFEEPIQEQEETFEDQVDDDETWEDLVGDEEALEDMAEDADPECPLEPDQLWNESVCGEIERRILSRVLGG